MKSGLSVLTQLLVYFLLAGGLFSSFACNAPTNPSETLQPLLASTKIPAPVTVTLNIQNYVPTPGNAFKDIFVSNFSLKVMQGQALPVSARDGMPDALKLAHSNDYGFVLPGGPYSTGFNFSDLFFFLAGIVSTQQPHLSCIASQLGSTTSDAFVYLDDRTTPSTPQFIGLRDCEKSYAGLKPTLFDNSGSGIPDYLKLKCGLNPMNQYDVNLSIANDSLTNKDKCKMNIPIDEMSTSDFNKLYAYNYSTKMNPDSSMNFSISNIAVSNGGVENFIAIYLMETNILTPTVPTLYTAYLIPKALPSANTFNISYWAPHPAPLSGSSSTSSPYPYGLNVEITAQ